MASSEEAVPKKAIPTKLTVNGKECDLTKILPLRVGDFRKFKKDHGFTQRDLGSGDLEATVKFTLLVLQKTNAAITEEDVDTISMPQLGDLMSFIANPDTVAAEVDHPTSPASTSSQQHTDGA